MTNKCDSGGLQSWARYSNTGSPLLHFRSFGKASSVTGIPLLKLKSMNRYRSSVSPLLRYFEKSVYEIKYLSAWKNSRNEQIK